MKLVKIWYEYTIDGPNFGKSTHSKAVMFAMSNENLNELESDSSKVKNSLLGRIDRALRESYFEMYLGDARITKVKSFGDINDTLVIMNGSVRLNGKICYD